MKALFHIFFGSFASVQYHECSKTYLGFPASNGIGDCAAKDNLTGFVRVNYGLIAFDL